MGGSPRSTVPRERSAGSRKTDDYQRAIFFRRRTWDAICGEIPPSRPARFFWDPSFPGSSRPAPQFIDEFFSVLEFAARCRININTLAYKGCQFGEPDESIAAIEFVMTMTREWIDGWKAAQRSE